MGQGFSDPLPLKRAWVITTFPDLKTNAYLAIGAVVSG